MKQRSHRCDSFPSFATVLSRLSARPLSLVALSIAAALLLGGFDGSSAWAQGRPIRLVVPFAPGGNIDAIGRLFASQLSESQGESWIVENISGGNGTIGTQALGKMPADGRSLMFVADGHAMAPLLMKNVPYDPLKDFEPVARVARAPLMFIANPAKVRATNLRELITEMRANPKQHAFSNAGYATWPHLAGEMFRARVGDSAADVPTVAYRGTGPAVAAVVSGEVTLMIVTPLAAMSMVRAGRLRALAVTSQERFEGAQEVPTAEEAGLQEFNFMNSYAFWGPKGISKDVLTRTSASIRKVTENSELRRRLLDLGVSVNFEPPEVFARQVAEESQRTLQMVTRIGLRPQ